MESRNSFVKSQRNQMWKHGRYRAAAGSNNAWITHNVSWTIFQILLWKCTNAIHNRMMCGSYVCNSSCELFMLHWNILVSFRRGRKNYSFWDVGHCHLICLLTTLFSHAAILFWRWTVLFCADARVSIRMNKQNCLLR